MSHSLKVCICVNFTEVRLGIRLHIQTSKKYIGYMFKGGILLKTRIINLILYILFLYYVNVYLHEQILQIFILYCLNFKRKNK